MRPLATVSIRVRVIAAVMAVLAVVLVALSFSVSAVFVAQSNRNLDTLLSGRAQLGRQLARAGARPQQIVNRVGVDGVLACTVRECVKVGEREREKSLAIMTCVRLATPSAKAPPMT